MKKFFVIALMSLGTSSVFAANQPVVRKFVAPTYKSVNLKTFYCTKAIKNSQGQIIGYSTGVSNTSMAEACAAANVPA
ncbi:MAG: hypothetical protein SFU27_08760 [Thermonemataceae bacterium]|nr:hypothetical protein [Thermonemataceae bacterium]